MHTHTHTHTYLPFGYDDNKMCLASSKRMRNFKSATIPFFIGHMNRFRFLFHSIGTLYLRAPNNKIYVFRTTRKVGASNEHYGICTNKKAPAAYSVLVDVENLFDLKLIRGFFGWQFNDIFYLYDIHNERKENGESQCNGLQSI